MKLRDLIEFLLLAICVVYPIGLLIGNSYVSLVVGAVAGSLLARWQDRRDAHHQA
jgi:hypothetical protein